MVIAWSLPRDMRRARHYCALSRGPTRGFSIGIVETGYIGVLREPHACHAQHLAGCDSCAARFDAPKRGSRAVLGYDELTDPALVSRVVLDSATPPPPW